MSRLRREVLWLAAAATVSCIGGVRPAPKVVVAEASVGTALPWPEGPSCQPWYANPADGLLEAPLAPADAPRVINHGRRDEKNIALTFDACSSPSHGVLDIATLDVLRATGTPATLFMGGKWMLDEPDFTNYLASLPGIELAHHGLWHNNLVGATVEEVTEEALGAADVLYTLTGRTSPYFRPPYAFYDATTAVTAGNLGMALLQYDVASGDPDKSFTAPILVRWVLEKTRGGSIIIMHINRHGWHTAEALPFIIGELQSRGYRFVTISELVARQLATPYSNESCRDPAEELSIAPDSIEN